MMIGTEEPAFKLLDEYSDANGEKMQIAYQMVAEQLDVTFTWTKRRYDQRVRFNVTDFVRFNWTGLRKKEVVSLNFSLQDHV